MKTKTKETTMKTIKIRGTIVPNEYRNVYEALNYDCFSPNMLELPTDGEDIVVNINSGGGDVYSGSEIYTELKEYQGKITVKIVGIAASMASVIAMAGDVVEMSPTSQMMIHNVTTLQSGDKHVMSHESEVLNGYDDTLANAYSLKSGLSKSEILDLMEKETWLTPDKAIKLGFADRILFVNEEQPLELVAKAKDAVYLSDEEIKQYQNQLQKEDGMAKEKDKEKEKDLDLEKQEPAEEEEVQKAEETEEDKEVEETEEAEEKEEEKEEPKFDRENYFNLNRVRNKLDQDALVKEQTHINEFKNEAPAGIELEKIGGIKPMENKLTYRDAFLNAVRDKKLSNEETEIIAKYNNVFIHDTENTSLVIPETTADRIFRRAGDAYGIYEDARKLNVNGNLRLVKHSGIKAGDADWYVEGTATVEEQNQFAEIELKGHELAKLVTVSWKLRAMAMDDFEDFLVEELGQRLGIALGTAVAKGDGTNKPKGVVAALADTDQTVEGGITYDNLLKAISKVHSAYKTGAKVYANSQTIWTELAGLKDGNERPYFIASAGQDGVGNILGFPVKEDAGLDDGEVVIGNAAQGYTINVNEDLSITTQEDAVNRRTYFSAYMVVDGAVVDDEAFAVIKPKAAAEGEDEEIPGV